jgi:hypothetical protein
MHNIRYLSDKCNVEDSVQMMSTSFFVNY